MDPIAQVRALTGTDDTQAPEETIRSLFAARGVNVTDGVSLGGCLVLEVAADLADTLAAGQISGSAVTAVEDITLDRRRVTDGWQGLADRLRVRADACWDDGPTVVEFEPYGATGVQQ
jgi:hypothetical protein